MLGVFFKFWRIFTLLVCELNSYIVFWNPKSLWAEHWPIKIWIFDFIRKTEKLLALHNYSLNIVNWNK